MNSELISVIFPSCSKVENVYIKNEVEEKDPKSDHPYVFSSELYADEKMMEFIGHIDYVINYFSEKPEKGSDYKYKKKPVYYPLIHCYLKMISINEEHQRKGFGTKLLEYMEEKLVELSKKSLARYLLIDLQDVSDSDFYWKNGYKSISDYSSMQKKFEFKNGELFYRLKYTEKELEFITKAVNEYKKNMAKNMAKKKKNKGMQVNLMNNDKDEDKEEMCN